MDRIYIFLLENHVRGPFKELYKIHNSMHLLQTTNFLGSWRKYYRSKKTTLIFEVLAALGPLCNGLLS